MSLLVVDAIIIDSISRAIGVFCVWLEVLLSLSGQKFIIFIIITFRIGILLYFRYIRSGLYCVEFSSSFSTVVQDFVLGYYKSLK